MVQVNFVLFLPLAEKLTCSRLIHRWQIMSLSAVNACILLGVLKGMRYYKASTVIITIAMNLVNMDSNLVDFTKLVADKAE